MLLAVAAAVTVLYRLGTPHGFFDLKIYMAAMRWWAAGNPLYDYVQPDLLQGELYFTYPPFAALLLRPFAGLPLGVTIVIFTALTVAAVAVTTWWLVAPLARRRGWPVWFPVAVAAGLALGVESTREMIGFGQINMLLVVLILADLLIAVPRGSRWAGVGVGLATAIKLFPGIFIIYLLVTRRWRTAAVASATAAGATLLAAAVAPRDSWRFWTQELWETNRVGRPDYTANQSLFGLLSRLTVPEKPTTLIWLLLVVAVAGYGLWRAARAARAGDELAGLTLTGLVGALVSPITWTHHVYWFIPALVVLVDAGLRPPAGSPEWPGARRRAALLALAAAGYVAITYGVVSYYDWGIAPEPTATPAEFLLRNLYVLFALVLLVVPPIRRGAPPPAAAVSPAAGSGRRRRGPAGTG
ncbi:MAG TPA: glycosyltransferase 87 family protein, partial [Micromonosporaceae bacterium]